MRGKEFAVIVAIDRRGWYHANEGWWSAGRTMTLFRNSRPHRSLLHAREVKMLSNAMAETMSIWSSLRVHERVVLIFRRMVLATCQRHYVYEMYRRWPVDFYSVVRS